MIPSDLCHFRTHRECGCHVGSCQQQPATPAPVIQASKRDAAVIWAFCIVMSAIAAFTVIYSIPSAAESYRRNALDQQENVSWAR